MRNPIAVLQFLSLFILAGCGRHGEKEIRTFQQPIRLTLEQANNLARLPLACMQTEYPNKPGETLDRKEELGEPHVIHPAFYGCFDWHSAVHGHWSLVKLLKDFAGLEQAETIRRKLRENLSAENIRLEVLYFQREQEKSFERTYGWAWLLKLAEELHTWNDPLARELENNLSPLTGHIAESFIEFLPRLKYPVRVGEHTNTAFGLAFAWDYANTTGHELLKTAIETRAREFYLHDVDCPLNWEPSGYDFLSPCFEEIDLMRRILGRTEFEEWVNQFAPRIKDRSFSLAVGEVADRTDGKLVHLDGLNFSRAWVMYGLAGQYPEFKHLINIANEHVRYSLPNLVDDTYEGGHWLGTFAVYALGNVDAPFRPEQRTLDREPLN